MGRKAAWVTVALVIVSQMAWAQPTSPAATEASLLGTWLVRTQELEVQLVLRVDGTFTRTARGIGQDGTFTGRYTVSGAKITFRDEGSAESTTLNYKLAGDLLTVTDDDGNGFQLARQPVPGTVPAPTVTSLERLCGKWVRQDGQPAVTYEFSADGSYVMTVKSALADARGTGKYRLQGNVLETTPDSGTPLRRYQYRLADPNTLELTDPAGPPMRFARDAAAQAPANIAQPATAAPTLVPPVGDLKVPLPLPRVAGGHLVYTRWVPAVAAAGGLQATGIVPKLFVMNSDGSAKQPFLTGEPFTSFKQARWSPKYDRLAFCSDWMMARSACMEDIFIARADGLGVLRVTGNELRAPAPEGYGIVTGLVEDNTRAEFVAATSPTEISVTAQGSDGTVFHPGQKVDVDVVNQKNEKLRDAQVHRFILPRVMAGKQVWLKLWKTPDNGSVHLIEVKPNQVNDVGPLQVSGATLKAWQPSLSDDQRYVVGMGSMTWLEYRTNRAEMGIAATLPGGYDPQFRKEREGADNVSLYDITRGGIPIAMFEPTRALGENAKDPALSPDGQWIAVAWGRALSENLALVSVADLIANHPNPRVLVQGQMILPNAVTTFQSLSHGAGSPAWSSDGRSIAFAYGSCTTDYNSAQIAVVKADGSGLRQLTNFPINQLACQPCFSPDGTQIAFTVLTGKVGPMRMENLIAMQFTSDIYVIGVDGTGLRRLTDDGASSEPAWGP